MPSQQKIRPLYIIRSAEGLLSLLYKPPSIDAFAHVGVTLQLRTFRVKQSSPNSPVEDDAEASNHVRFNIVRFIHEL